MSVEVQSALANSGAKAFSPFQRTGKDKYLPQDEPGIRGFLLEEEIFVIVSTEDMNVVEIPTGGFNGIPVGGIVTFPESMVNDIFQTHMLTNPQDRELLQIVPFSEYAEIHNA